MRKNSQQSNQQGFTLIELLIVTSILSLLMFTGSYAYSLFANKWQSELGQFDESNRRTMGFYRLQTLLTTVSPYAIRKDNGQPAFLFIGANDSLLAITHDGLFSRDAAEAFRLTAVKTDNGKFKLLYQAKSLIDTAILTESQSIEFTVQLVLAEQLDRISFQYFGWSSFQDKKGRNADNLIGQHQWYSKYSGIDKQLMPEKIEVQLTQGEKTITFLINLDSTSERWLTPYFDQDNG